MGQFSNKKKCSSVSINTNSRCHGETCSSCSDSTTDKLTRPSVGSRIKDVLWVITCIWCGLLQAQTQIRATDLAYYFGKAHKVEREWKYTEWQKKWLIKYSLKSWLFFFVFICLFFRWWVRCSSLWLTGSVCWGMREFLLACQHPFTPQLSALPCSSWPSCLSAAVTGGRGRWIRATMKVSTVLTPL